MIQEGPERAVSSHGSLEFDDDYAALMAWRVLKKRDLITNSASEMLMRHYSRRIKFGCEIRPRRIDGWLSGHGVSIMCPSYEAVLTCLSAWLSQNA